MTNDLFKEVLSFGSQDKPSLSHVWPKFKQLEQFFVRSKIQFSSMKYLEHENVLKANGVSLDNNRNPVLILPYVVNGDLAAYLRRENQPLCYSQEIADL